MRGGCQSTKVPQADLLGDRTWNSWGDSLHELRRRLKLREGENGTIGGDLQEVTVR